MLTTGLNQGIELIRGRCRESLHQIQVRVRVSVRVSVRVQLRARVGAIVAVRVAVRVRVVYLILPHEHAAVARRSVLATPAPGVGIGLSVQARLRSWVRA